MSMQNTRRMLVLLATMLLVASAFFVFSGDAVSVYAQSSNEMEEQAQADRQLIEKLRSMNIPVPLPQALVEKGQEFDLQKRPLLAFRIWANKPKRFIPSFFFCLLTSLCAWAFFPRSLAAAKPVCRKHFWRSLFVGIFVCALTLLFVRALFFSVIGSPLALLLLGVLEFGFLLGLSVIVSLIGETILSRTGLAGTDYFSKHAKVKQVTELVLGVTVICLLLLIPGFAGLPRIGIRLVVLLCELGLGAYLHARRLACVEGKDA